MYLTVRKKFSVSLATAMAWAAFSLWVSTPWFHDLASLIGPFAAGFLILFIAVIPGFMNAFLASSLLLDKRPPRKPLPTYPGLTLLIAAYNEHEYIEETINSIGQQRYPGELEAIVIDDGSRDQTAALVRARAARLPWLRCISLEKNMGKANALNRGLAEARHDLVVTVDGDCYLAPEALVRIVERYRSDPANTRAVAGATMVRNSRDNWLTEAQEWDYFQGIATVKRVQSLNQGTLVAQGAFSLYDKAALQEVGGWPITVGEDIALTWALLEKGHRVGYCEDGVVFKVAPNTLSGFVRQRQRWARGMVESFKRHPRILFKGRLSVVFIWWDLLLPLMDIAYTFGFIPGLVMAAFGNFAIAGPMMLSLIPLALAINLVMYHRGKKMFEAQGLQVRKNLFGFLFYALPYGLILQPSAVLGYISEVLNWEKKWGTK